MPGFEVIGKEEQEAANQVFEEGGILFAHGFDALRKRFHVREFERQFADKVGARYAQAVSSGTAALKVALVAMGVNRGDEVITQAFTFVATVEAIADLGAVPVVVNVNDTLNMDPEELEGAITPRTRAILPVHMLGVAAEMDRILAIADRAGIPVLEDNCESLGATWEGRVLGTGGSATAWSFDFGKVITSGEGGMVTTNDEELYRLAAEYQDHGHENNPEFPRGRDTHRISGFNFRLTELQAAVGKAQLAKLDSIVATNRRNWSILRETLDGIDGLTFRRVPAQCEPLGDCLIFELPSQSHVARMWERMLAAGLGTKILPDAWEWHFAGKWDHLFRGFGLTAAALADRCYPTYERLMRCISLPVMVRHSAERTREIAGQVREIARDIL